MKAKDTVIGRPKHGDKCPICGGEIRSSGFSGYPFCWGKCYTYLHSEKYQMLIRETQAEISFKAGIREVVEWLKKREASCHYLGEKRYNFKVVEEEWQAKLREWGL